MLVVAVMLGGTKLLDKLPFFTAQWSLVGASAIVVLFPFLVRYHPWFADLRGYVLYPLGFIGVVAVIIGMVASTSPIGRDPILELGFGGCCFTLSGIWILWLIWLGFRNRGRPD